jgi:Na+/H+ antiporter
LTIFLNARCSRRNPARSPLKQAAGNPKSKFVPRASNAVPAPRICDIFICGEDNMETTGIQSVELVILLLLVLVAAFAALAKKWQTPYPIILVIGGLIISFVPHLPRVRLEPDIVFLVILPPLLFSSAYVTSWRDFRYNLFSIGMLAFGLVGFTVIGVAAAALWILPGFDWRMGLVLGAIVSTTDAIAATSIAKRLSLPKRITDILEEESLVNDASGLLALEFATALIVSGLRPTLVQGAGRLLYLIVASIAIGLLLGKLIHFVESKIDDSAIEITISLIAPYVAYLAAESIHTSGVLATVACGLYLGHKSSLYLSTGARLTGAAVWETLTFILNGFVFLLIGLQLPYILAGIRGFSLARLLVLGALFSGVVILLRLIWIFPGAWISNFVRRRILHQDEPLPNPRSVFIVGWTGMRGVIALAAAISLPELLSDGTSFPQREVMIFLTFCVIFVTLVLQGLTLPTMIRHLGLAGLGGNDLDEEKARRAMVDAALAYLQHARESEPPESASVYDTLIRFQSYRLKMIDGKAAEDPGKSRDLYERYREVSGHVLALQRATILHMRNENQINDESLRKLEYELDLMEARFATSGHG